MLISYAKKFIYLKTSKTAGTSIEVAFQSECMPPGAAISHFTPQIVSEYGIVGARGLETREKNEWFNHMPAVAIKAKIAEDKWNNYFKFCCIRNPWDKVVSRFHFQNPEAKALPKEEFIAQFRQWSVDGNVNHDRATHFISDKPVCDDYIRYDRLSSDYERICDKIGVEVKEIPRLKMEFRGDERVHYSEYYDDASREVVQRVFGPEIELFGWTYADAN